MKLFYAESDWSMHTSQGEITSEQLQVILDSEDPMDTYFTYFYKSSSRELGESGHMLFVEEHLESLRTWLGDLERPNSSWEGEEAMMLLSRVSAADAQDALRKTLIRFY